METATRSTDAHLNQPQRRTGFGGSRLRVRGRVQPGIQAGLWAATCAFPHSVEDHLGNVPDLPEENRLNLGVAPVSVSIQFPTKAIIPRFPRARVSLAKYFPRPAQFRERRKQPSNSEGFVPRSGYPACALPRRLGSLPVVMDEPVPAGRGKSKRLHVFSWCAESITGADFCCH